MQLKMSRYLIAILLLLAFSTTNAQQMEDLGRTKPFLIGLKGTIYNFVFPTCFFPLKKNRVLFVVSS